ncbi:MAG TPA: PAS domain-containing hybrid sensor histidine kinase/response regulator [Dokdonella sp.]|uniref:hybrid sensor histidine kinase/response regulator n=2 Tax=Dokdonella sp. TaxID=2291710 RepID=UPI002BEAADAD|nr:PAS domain-containing hybrid sensor histidine kinase/response regulator [Dokdonella sp.]HOX71212.1 PAS domain-containing hybrid sensor histidine kinase/response regulator [Dokdonella sp.]
MIAGWVLMLVSLAYVAMLFGIAYFGDSRPLYPTRPALRPVVYSLALAVYCSSWTFYGAVGSAAQSSLSFLPIYLGPILLFVFGSGLLQRLIRVAKANNITSIADFIGSRFGKSHALGALVTIIAVTAAIPYIALQFKAVALSVGILSGGQSLREHVPLLNDSALYVAIMLALFAILFGTRRIDATEHHHGLMLAIAAESVMKLVAFVAVGLYALNMPTADTPGRIGIFAEIARDGLPSGFFAQTLLAFTAMFCLPRQFQVGVVECEDPADVPKSRFLFPVYLAIICVLVLPIVDAGREAAAGAGISPDALLLWLPLSHADNGLAILAYVGGFSAATGMVIVASVALATMISNDLVMPALLRVRALKLDQRNDVSAIVLRIRRVAIVMLALMAFAYYRAISQSQGLAAIGLLAFAAVAQFAPAIIAGLYWRGASRRGILSGLVIGFAVWIYTLLLPSMATAAWVDATWVDHGLFGQAWLRPRALFNLSGWDPITHGTFWSLLANIGACVFVSLRFRPSVEERLRAASFLDAGPDRGSAAAGEWRGRVSIADLRVITGRILGEQNAGNAFQEYATSVGSTLDESAAADRAMLQYTERLLAAAIGSASARRMLTTALRGTGLDFSEAVALLDEASQELRFNRELLSTTLENISQGISVVDAEMRMVSWNRRYLEMFDYPDGLVYVGRPIADLIRYNAERGECGPGEVDEHVIKRLRHMRAGTAHVFQRERADGSVLEMRGQQLPGGGFVTTFTDVSDYKKVELALINANETLEQRVTQRTVELTEALDAQEQAKLEAQSANLSKSRFLAAASHDLLQPLNAARLFTSALRHQPNLDAESAQLAERIDTAFRVAEDLLESLLESSRLDAGKYLPEISEIAIADLIEPLVQQFSLLARRRGLDFRVIPSRAVIRSDPHLLRRILQNFCTNALRYTRTGRVVLGVRHEGDDVRIELWDTGLGIAHEQLQQIFDEFHRVDGASPWGEQGLGLGLSICERIARILGHPLRVRSWPDHGSCFAIQVPRVRMRNRDEFTPPRSTALAGELRALHVLCLDNEPSILEGMSSLLTRWGLSCDLAANREEALQALLRRKPDLILVDLHLGSGPDGIEVLGELLRHCDPAPRAALITADASPELKQRAKSIGLTVLLKPVRPAALRALLSAYSRRSRTSLAHPSVNTAADIGMEAAPARID